MRFLTARRLALAAALPVLFSFSIIPGCSKQGEGERCGTGTSSKDSKPDDSDCDDGLTCQLIESSTGTYRCCSPTRLTSARCVPVTSTSSAGAAGTGGASGASSAGTGGASGASSAGTGGASGASTAGGGGETSGSGGADAAAGEPGSMTESGAGGV